MQRAPQAFDAGGVRVDDAFAADAYAGGRAAGFEQPTHGLLERGQEGVEIAGSGDGARGQDGALIVHHAAADLVSADIDSEYDHLFGSYQAPTGVYREDLPGDGARTVSQQEQGRARNVFHIDHASGERLLLADEVRDRGGGLRSLSGGRAGQARRHYVDADAVRRVVGDRK